MSQVSLTIYSALYSRVSTTAQLPGGSIQHQFDKAEKLAQDCNTEVIARFSDEGVSGVLYERAGLQELIRLAQASKIQVIFYYDGDRIGRDWTTYAQIVRTLERDCRVQMVDVSYPIFVPPSEFDPYSQDRVLYHSMKGMMSELAYRQLLTRMKAGRDRAIARGQKITGNAPYGYKTAYDTNGAFILLPEPTEYPLLPELLRLVRDGHSLTSIVRIINSSEYPVPRAAKNWGGGTLIYLLHNPWYAGKVSFNRSSEITKTNRRRERDYTKYQLTDHKCYEGCLHPWTWAEFEEIQLTLKQHSQFPPRSTGSRHPLSGLLKCAICNGTLSYATDGQGHEYYRCGSRFRDVPTDCPGFAIRRDLAFKLIFDYFDLIAKQFYKNPAKFILQYFDEKTAADITPTLDRQKGNLAKLFKQRNKIEDDYLDETLSKEEYRRMGNRLAEKIETQEELVKGLEQEAVFQRNRQKVIGDFEQVFTSWELDRARLANADFKNWDEDLIDRTRTRFRQVFMQIAIEKRDKKYILIPKFI